MASEYMKWMTKDVKPDEPPPPLTRKGKINNWIYYRKWWIVVWIILIWFILSIAKSVLGIGKVKPDYVFAYIGSANLPDDCVAALERELAALGEDVNRDGKVVVELRQYVSGEGQNMDDVLMYGYASEVTLVADINEGESYFFLMEDPEAVQERYALLADADGLAPASGDYGIEGRAWQWTSCPVLEGMDLGEYQAEYLGRTYTGDNQSLLSGLYLGRRYFIDEKRASKQEDNEKFWEILIEGAES